MELEKHDSAGTKKLSILDCTSPSKPPSFEIGLHNEAEDTNREVKHMSRKVLKKTQLFSLVRKVQRETKKILKEARQ